ncbi:MAG TPA: biotin transporter BioY [Balneolales bacterium]|nr:biotin transporter BioY [Balneolales bacterium]
MKLRGTTVTYADIIRPQTKSRAKLYDAALILSGSLMIALTAQIAIPLPFTPVPITGQMFGVLMIPALLGSRRGVMAVAAYLAEGLAGLPFFAGGMAGPAILMGTTGGYLIGFLIAALVVGYLSEQGWDRKVGSTFLMMALAVLIDYAFGAIWLSHFLPSSMILDLGILPFVIGDALKVSLVAMVLPAGWKGLRSLGVTK